MALKLNGKDDRLTPDDFRQLGRILEIPAARVDGLLAATANAARDIVGDIRPPPVALPPNAAGTLDRIREIVEARARALG